MEKKYCRYSECGRLLMNTSESREFCDNNNRCKNKFHYNQRKLKVELANSLIINTLIFEEYKRKFNILMKDRRIKIIPEADLRLMGIDTTCELFQIKELNKYMVSLKFLNYKVFHFLNENNIAIYKPKIA